MKFSQACEKLAEFIKAKNICAQRGGLAVAVFVDAITQDGETPSMALAMAKNVATNPAAVA